MGKHLVVVGGGHAHLTALLLCGQYIEQGHHVTLINPSPYHYYSGMGPGMLAGTYRPQDIRFHVKKMAEDRGATFIEDAVIRIDPEDRRLHLKSGKTVEYDLLSCNTGSGVRMPFRIAASRNVFPVKPIESLVSARHAALDIVARKRIEIVVIGGGPAGIEMAANIWRLIHDQNGKGRITLVAGGGLLRTHPERVRRMARQSLARRGIIIRDVVYAVSIVNNVVELTTGTPIAADLILVAAGISPSGIFAESGLPTGQDGGMLVDRFLRSTGHPEIFGGGDCISFGPGPLAKVGVYAVRQNMVLHRNILAGLNGGVLTQFRPQRTFMLIFNMGDDTAILTRNNLTLDGRLAWWIKDRIDRGFMQKFRVSGEQEEDLENR